MLEVKVIKKELNVKTRSLKLDAQGRMAIRFPDGSTLLDTPENLFGGKEDIRVVNDVSLDEAILKELSEELTPLPPPESL